MASTFPSPFIGCGLSTSLHWFLISNSDLLTPIQQATLETFPRVPGHEQFYLTGGTALAAFHLHHRLSYDLDFFTSETGIIIPFSHECERVFRACGWSVEVVRRFPSFVEPSLKQESPGDILRVDVALDSPFRLEPCVTTDLGLRVNSYRDLLADKLLAFFGRTEPRDAVDLYFML